MKKILSLVICLLVCFFSLVACATKYEHFTNVVNNFEYSHITLINSESATLDITSIFSSSGIAITDYKLAASPSDIVKIEKNKITPIKSGIATLSVALFEKQTKTEYGTVFANVYSIVEKDLTPISTKEDLIALQNKRSGNYIIKNNINLSGVDWEPIGNNPANNEFTGMMVNLSGYKISNLTITSSYNVFHGPYGGCKGGLFGSTSNSFFYGIELDNIDVDIRDFISERSDSGAGGISGLSLGDTFYKCKVSGNLKSTSSAGGIAATSSWSRFIECEFVGKIVTTKEDNVQAGSGGICGYIGGGRIVNCTVTAEIKSNSQSGYIAGWCETYSGIFRNNIHTGSVLSSGLDVEFGRYFERPGIDNIN